MRKGADMGKTIRINKYKVLTTDKEKMKGLMFSKKVEKKLVFLFSDEVDHSFHSFFCPVFDIFFLNSKKEIIHFESVTKSKIIKCNRKYRYVVETELGFAKKNKLKIGDRIEWD
jgi:uncharacterized membrane protein (UPF0127 family)